MTRKCQLAREIKRKKLIIKYLYKRVLLRKAQSDNNLPSEKKEEAMIKLGKLPRDSSSSRKSNRCFLSGTSHSVYKKFMLGRIAFRKMALEGLLPGVRKSSW